MPMLPIKDGSVELKKPGMMYKFTAFPKGRVDAEFKGIGKGQITQMKAEVEVDLKRFRQPGGPEPRSDSMRPRSMVTPHTWNLPACSFAPPTESVFRSVCYLEV